MSDLCLDEFTSHGHCGVLAPDGSVDNDATLAALRRDGGGPGRTPASHVVGPSGMMDGQVGVVRRALDAAGYADVPILAYAVEVRLAPSTARSATPSSPPSSATADLPAGPGQPPRGAARGRAGRRRGRRHRHGQAGAALPRRPVGGRGAAVDVPVAAYQVSGEYAMVEAAAANGWLDRDRVMLETLTSIRRAGAQIILTYWAVDAARLLRP